MDSSFFKGKTVLVMGLGRFGGGVDSARFAAKHAQKVIVADLADADKLKASIEAVGDRPNVEFHLGNHDPADFRCADIVIANPAVPIENEFLQIAAKAGAFITWQMNIFFELCPAKIVGITGANGKSTTTALTAYILRASVGKDGFDYKNVWLGGNIGNQPLLDTIDKITECDIVVLELSSFQTEQLCYTKRACDVAVLTNLTPNHLDRHGTFENYILAKENIFKYQRLDVEKPAVSIFNAEDEIAAEMFKKYSGDEGRESVLFRPEDVSEQIAAAFKLAGRANRSNLSAAIAVARIFGVKDKWIIEALASFKSLPHRLELVAESDGVRWYNDSIATTPQSSIVALEAFEEPKIIIAGGYDKNLPFDEFGKKIASSAKAAVLIGNTAKKIASVIDTAGDSKAEVFFADSLAAAVETARRIADAGDVVLLSPACASYDMFDNFEQRGKEFARLANQKSSSL